MRDFLLFLVVATCLAARAEARTIYYGSETEVVPVSFGTTYLFRFPADVRTITQASRFEIGPADRNQPNYSLLSVRPRFSTGSSQVTFILNDGSMVKTKLTIKPKSSDNADTVFDFKTRDSVVESEASGTGSDLPAMELMKALIRGDEVSGYSIKNYGLEVSPGFKGVTVKLLRKYIGDKFHGYIYEISKNRSKQKLLINLQNLSLGDPNVALLSSVDQAVLDSNDPKTKKTFLRVVAKPTARYDDLVLPVEIVEKKEGAKQ